MKWIVNLFFLWLGPKPKFEPGQLVSVSPDATVSHSTKKRYMLIRRRHWFQPRHFGYDAQWGYDGPIYTIKRDELKYSTGGSEFLEKDLSPL